MAALQSALCNLGYWVDTTGGSFEDSTEQAVWALRKAAGLTTDGVVGPATWEALLRGVVPQPRSTSGYVVEVDLEGRPAHGRQRRPPSGHVQHLEGAATPAPRTG